KFREMRAYRAVIMAPERFGMSRPRIMKETNEYTSITKPDLVTLCCALVAVAGASRRHLFLPWFHRSSPGGVDRSLRQLAVVSASVTPLRRQAQPRLDHCYPADPGGLGGTLDHGPGLCPGRSPELDGLADGSQP